MRFAYTSGNSAPISEEIKTPKINEEDKVYRKGIAVIPINLQLNMTNKWDHIIDPTDWFIYVVGFTHRKVDG